MIRSMHILTYLLFLSKKIKNKLSIVSNSLIALLFSKKKHKQTGELNGENKHGKEGLSIYYDLQHSSINANTIFGSNLRVYLKKTNNCECKLNADQLIQLSLYDAPSKVTFTPFTGEIDFLNCF